MTSGQVRHGGVKVNNFEADAVLPGIAELIVNVNLYPLSQKAHRVFPYLFVQSLLDSVDNRIRVQISQKQPISFEYCIV